MVREVGHVDKWLLAGGGDVVGDRHGGCSGAGGGIGDSGSVIIVVR